MTLPVSGAISFNAINVELGVAGTTQASLNQASYRTLAGVPSGAISLSDFYGKANQFAFTISSNQTNANLRTLAVNAGWNESVKVVATIGSGIYCSSDSTGTPGLTVNGSFPGGVELINNGFIIGRGGAGGTGGVSGSGGTVAAGSAGSAGGLALSVSSAISINNAGTIGGGGGGGGGGGAGRGDGYNATALSTGSGGGGGRSGQTNSTGGARGTSVLGNSSFVAVTLGVVGSAGTAAAAAAQTARPSTANKPPATAQGGFGGAGGNWGSSGSAGGTSSANVDDPTTRAGGAGGAAGGAITGNSNITYIATGTRLGAIT
jgi:hypothetical protein